GLGARVIDVLDREIELVFVPFGIAAVLAAAVGQHPQQLNLMGVEEWQHPVVQEIGRTIVSGFPQPEAGRRLNSAVRPKLLQRGLGCASWPPVRLASLVETPARLSLLAT